MTSHRGNAGIASRERWIGLVVGAAFVLAVTERAPTLSAQEHNAPHWSYAGATSPTHWGELDSAFAACARGHGQSPIALRSSHHGPASFPTFSYATSPINVVNNGHTIQANVAPGSIVVADGDRYELRQFHFHHPSEHTLDGAQYPAELHFVHADAQGRLLVVGLLATEGAENQALAPLLDATPKEAGDSASVSSFDLKALMDDYPSRGALRYAGSLTTPPCTEGVQWVVLRQPVQLSKEQLHRLVQLLGKNARPVQAPYGRVVTATP
jgi:carbonic anhydrase